MIIRYIAIPNIVSKFGILIINYTTRIQGRQIDSGVIAKFEFHDLYSEGQLVIDLIGYKFGTTLL